MYILEGIQLNFDSPFTRIIDGKEEYFHPLWLRDSTQEQRDAVGIIWVDDVVPTEPEVNDIPVTIPVEEETVDALQIRKALNASNLRTEFEAIIATSNISVKDWWEFSTVIKRDSTELADICAAMTLASNNVEDLFHLAKTL